MEPNYNERNFKTYRRHRREVWWQVFLPLLLGVLVIGIVSGGLASTGVPDASTWTDVSLIWLILPVCVLGLVPFALSVALIVGATLGLQRLPGLALLVQQFMRRMEDTIRRAADRAAEPVLQIGSVMARLRALQRKRG